MKTDWTDRAMLALIILCIVLAFGVGVYGIRAMINESQVSQPHYHEGYNAGQTGVPVEADPYHRHQLHSRAWRQGWIKGWKERQVKQGD